MRPTKTSLALTLSSLALAGCSLAQLDNFPIPPCTPGAHQCEVLNTERGVSATADRRWSCRVMGTNPTGTCAMGPRDDDEDGDPTSTDCDESASTGRLRRSNGTESCDGVDNDCNGVIDEGALVPAAMTVSDLASGADMLTSLHAARDSAGRLSVVFSRGDGASAVTTLVTRGETGAPSIDMLAARSQVEIPGSATGDPITNVTFASGCYPSRTGCTLGQSAFAEIDATTGRMLIASVDVAGCADGRLVVGLADRGASDVLYAGPPTRSAVVFGVDAAAAGACTGTRSATAQGASRPVMRTIARAGSARSQALLAYLARGSSMRCTAPEAPVNVMGVWADADAYTPYVQGSGGNRPTVLGTTRSDSSPAIAAVEEPPGYLVGFSDAAAGAVQLFFVPAADATSPAACRTDVTCLNEPAMTAALGTPVSLGSVRADGGMRAEQVTIAVGLPRTGGREFGVTWSAGGCGGSPSEVWVATMIANLGAPGAHATERARMRASANAESPSMLYLRDGVLVPGSTHGGAMVTPQTAGGWLVSWVDTSSAPSRLALRRLAEIDGQWAETDAVLLDAAAANGAPLRDVVLVEGAQGMLPVSFVARDASANALRTGTLLCGASP